jgi:hypothetical protein
MMTLVYSPGYLPIDVFPVCKAVAAVVMGKARTEEAHPERVFRSQKLTIPAPRSIVLLANVDLPSHMYRPARPTLENLILRDGGCQYCGKSESELRRARIRLTRDHIIPRSRGGSDSFRNLVAACQRCNGQKGARTPEEAGMTLLSKPRTPTEWELVLLREERRR